MHFHNVCHKKNSSIVQFDSVDVGCAAVGGSAADLVPQRRCTCSSNCHTSATCYTTSGPLLLLCFASLAAVGTAVAAAGVDVAGAGSAVADAVVAAAGVVVADAAADCPFVPRLRVLAVLFRCCCKLELSEIISIECGIQCRHKF